MHRACCWSALAISWPCMQRVHAWPHSPTTMQAPWPITGHRHDQPSIACCLSTCSRCLPSMISTVPSSATPRLQHSNHGTRLHATSHAQHGSHTRLHASSHASSSTGSRAAGLPVVWHPMYSAPQLSPGHRFPMQVWCHPHLPNAGVMPPTSAGCRCDATHICMAIHTAGRSCQ